MSACGGDDMETASPTATTAPAATGAEAMGTTTGAAAGPTSGPLNDDTPAMSEIVDLRGLESFRWDIAMSGAGSWIGMTGLPTAPGGTEAQFTARGAYIAPDQAQVIVSIAGVEYKQTVKGGQQWSTAAGVAAGPVPATTSVGDLIYVTTFLDPKNVVEGGSMECGGTENVNGLAAVRCETTDEVNEQIVADFAGQGATTDDASFVIWVAKEGNFIARWQFDATGAVNGQAFEWSFLANIMDVNNVGAIDP